MIEHENQIHQIPLDDLTQTHPLWIVSEMISVVSNLELNSVFHTVVEYCVDHIEVVVSDEKIKALFEELQEELIEMERNPDNKEHVPAFKTYILDQFYPQTVEVLKVLVVDLNVVFSVISSETMLDLRMRLSEYLSGFSR
jgi:hypothetical protein